jgi:hypothetical protein
MSNSNVSAIDKAIQAALARKKAKENGTEASASTAAPAAKAAAKPQKVAKVAEPKAAKVSEEEKAAKLAKRDAERAQKKAERDAAREKRKEEREEARKARTPHMSKVTKAAEKLPELSEEASKAFNEIVMNFNASQVAALSAHLSHYNRVKATERALDRKLEVGDTVLIVSGDPRFINKVGTVAKVQRIRCYVDVDGFNKPAYLFTSDVELATIEEVAAPEENASSSEEPVEAAASEEAEASSSEEEVAVAVNG